MFICLANSHKLQERCIAGIEVAMNRDGIVETVLDQVSGQRITKVWSGGTDGVILKIISSKFGPKWIRPVADAEHGQVPTGLIKNIQVLNIVSIDNLRPVPNGYQSENVLFNTDSILGVGNIKPNIDVLDVLAETQSFLFGNTANVISAAEIGNVGRSLILIKPAQCEFYRDDYQGKLKIRCKFIYSGYKYDLPVTDVKFKEQYSQNVNILQNINNYYLTISVGVEFNGLYYKLVAGVIYF